MVAHATTVFFRKLEHKFAYMISKHIEEWRELGAQNISMLVHAFPETIRRHKIVAGQKLFLGVIILSPAALEAKGPKVDLHFESVWSCLNLLAGGSVTWGWVLAVNGTWTPAEESACIVISGDATKMTQNRYIMKKGMSLSNNDSRLCKMLGRVTQLEKWEQSGDTKLSQDKSDHYRSAGFRPKPKA